MKALTLNDIDSPLQLAAQQPLEPRAGEVVIQVKSAALNRRDFWITKGLYPGIEPPVVLGSDGAGLVVRRGEGVDELWQDKEVVINPGLNWGDNARSQSDQFAILGLPDDGTFATEVRVPLEQVHLKPSHLNWHEAASLPLAGVTAYRALFVQGELKPGDRVLISGIGGGVASMAMLFAVAAGAAVWVTSSSDTKVESAVSRGAMGGINYKTENWSESFCQKNGFIDVVIDGSGGAGYRELLNVAAPGGRIVNYGATAGPPESLDLFKVFWKQLAL